MAVNRIPRIILSGDTERAGYKAREGMRQLNILKELMGFQKLKQDVRRVQYIDKSEIVCKSIFGEDVVEIYVPKKEEGRVSKKPVVLVAVGYHAPLFAPEPGLLNPYIAAYAYPKKVMLYDVEEDEIIETNMTTMELKERHDINVWHTDQFGNLTDRGLRLSDDLTHEKSYPLSRYLFNTEGFGAYTYTYAHGAHAYTAVSWEAESTPPPLPPTNPTVPSSCTGGCLWNTPRYEDFNRNDITVDTKGTGIEAVNSHTRLIYHEQYDKVFQNCRLGYNAACPSETTGIINPLGGGARADWRCKFGSPANRIIFENYARFGGSYRLTTRDKYPSLETGCVGYIQTKYDDYQDQASHVWGAVQWGGFTENLPDPTYIYSYERKINIIVECSFGEIYRTEFSHGTYDYWTCNWKGTQGVNGDPFEFPGVQQVFVGIEAGIINDKVISVATAVAGTERKAWPYIGDYANPCKWDNQAQYNQPKVQGVIAEINVTELDKELEYVDMIMSANDINYFSLPIEEDNNFKIAVNELVEEYYKEDCHDSDNEFVDPAICIESRVIEQHSKKRVDGGESIWYSSCLQSNPWLTPKIDQEFWRLL